MDIMTGDMAFCSLLSVLLLPVRLSWPVQESISPCERLSSYLSGGGQRSWKDVAGVDNRCAWLGEALSDRVSPLLVHG